MCIYTLSYRYARQRIDSLRATNLLRPHSRFAKWADVTEAEMSGFLAIILNMGLIEMPNIEDYWSTSWVSLVSFFPSVMSRDRFELIFWMLHVSHAEDGRPAQRIDKVKALLQVLTGNFKRSYMPSRELAVDETMVGFRGRFGPKQYMPNKPVKYGSRPSHLQTATTGTFWMLSSTLVATQCRKRAPSMKTSLSQQELSSISQSRTWTRDTTCTQIATTRVFPLSRLFWIALRPSRVLQFAIVQPFLMPSALYHG